MAQLDAHQPSKTFRGTIDEVFSHRSEIPAGATVELKVLDEDSSNADTKSLADVLQEIGTVAGLPADLSTNPRHMKGFGETKTPQAS
jgi:hypothetical protein